MLLRSANIVYSVENNDQTRGDSTKSIRIILNLFLMVFSGYLGVEQPESDAGSLKLSPLPFRITEERTNSTIDIEGEESVKQCQ